MVIMKMNELMARRHREVDASRQLENTKLESSLIELASAELIDTGYGLVQKPLLQQMTGPSPYPDKTGFEAAVSKIHIEDFLADDVAPDEAFVQGLLYAEHLVEALSNRPERFRVFLCVDEESNAVTCRFHVVRLGETWGYVDLNDSLEESIAVWDINV